MLQGFINGITNMISNIGNAVKGIADKVKSFLHFSKPDEGPLRDYETWMPDMIQGLSRTLNESAPKLYKASKNLASNIASRLNISDLIRGAYYKINTDFIPKIQKEPKYNENIQTKNIIEETLIDILLDSQKDVKVTIPLTLNVGNKKLGEIVLEDLRNIKRQSGKNIEALVN